MEKKMGMLASLFIGLLIFGCSGGGEHGTDKGGEDHIVPTDTWEKTGEDTKIIPEKSEEWVVDVTQDLVFTEVEEVYQKDTTESLQELYIEEIPEEELGKPEPYYEVVSLDSKQADDVGAVEVASCVPPLDPYLDEDGDGYPNGIEQKNGTDPCDAESKPDDLDQDGIPDAEDDDIDGDGVVNLEDDFPFDPDETVDSDKDGIGDNQDEDDDNDGYLDEMEIELGYNPKDPKSKPQDIDLDGIPDDIDDDIDGDGIANDEDAFPYDPKEWEDTDNDGIGDNMDQDDDGDGYPDYLEIEKGTDPKDKFSYPSDLDGDGILDTEDTDIDGDGIPNELDAFPKDPLEWKDSDKDGLGDNSDEDDDNDGYPDIVEEKYGTDPKDSKSMPPDLDGDGVPDMEDVDIDGDGEPNVSDVFPFDPSEWRDTDKDGLGDNADPDDDNDGFWDVVEEKYQTDPKDPKSHPLDTDGDLIPDQEDADIDNDGYKNSEDAFPYDPNEWEDTDGDGVGDNSDPDDDNDGYPDELEKKYGTDPKDPKSVPLDLDNDGIPDLDDSDMDGDGIHNKEDAFPKDPTEWLDTDGDGKGDNADSDDDNDGYPDEVEIALGSDPKNPMSVPSDMDKDGIPDVEDPDIDGDGFLNEQDAFPKDPKEWMDTDQDGIGDNADVDDDGDCYLDLVEIQLGTDPLDDSSKPEDLDNDCLPDLIDTDIDGDGIPNTKDAFPNDPLEWEDSDNDGVGNNADPDDDNDGYLDIVEKKYNSDPLDPKSTPPDMDNDKIPDPEDIDRDGDGVINEKDAFPDDPTKWEAYIPPGTYGEEYQEEIPIDADKDAFIPSQFALVRGEVRFENGEPAYGAKVKVLNHPEYGTAYVKKDGTFVIPVNGGGYVTVEIEAKDYPIIQRTVKVGWNDVVAIPKVELTALDPKMTEVTFNGVKGDVAVHQNVGVLAPLTAILPKDAEVVAKDADGNPVSIAEVVIRATEYPTEASMPNVLPPTSQFTYCVEAEALGYSDIQFDKAVVLWLPNTLGFDVGDAVPVGYYDRTEATWKPMPDGVVVKFLDTDGDTVIDAIDADGDGLPDDLTKDGTFSDEIMGLTKVKGFKPNDTAFRVEVKHFSPLDLNYPGGPPPDAIPPNGDDPNADNRDKNPDKDNPCKKVGYSAIDSRTRVVHEDIPFGISGMGLHYSSEWVEGFAQPINIPLSGSTVPASLKAIRARYGVAGLVFEAERPPLPKQSITFLWDGKDYLGNTVTKKTKVWTDVTFVYPSYYYSNRAQLQANIATFASQGVKMTGIGSRQDATLTRHFEFPIYRFKPKSIGNGTKMPEGWVIHPYWFYDPVSGVIVSSLGKTYPFKDLGKTIQTFGVGTLPAAPVSIATDSKAMIFFVGKDQKKIWMLDQNNAIKEVVSFNKPIDDITIGPNDTLHFSSQEMVYRVNKVGQVQGLANLFFDFYDCFAYYGAYCKVQIAIDGRSYLYAVGKYPSQMGENRMVIVTPDGQVLRFPLPFSCVVSDLAIDEQGRAYFSCQNGPIHVMEPDGKKVTQMLGWNEDCAEFWAYSGGGGIHVLEDGSILVADTKCHRIRKIDPRFGATTIAGTGVKGFGGDGGAPMDAKLNSPSAILVGPDGFIYIADTGNNRIRRIMTRGVEKDSHSIPLDNGLLLEFNDAFALEKVRDAVTKAILMSYAYDENGRLISIADNEGNQVSLEYDAEGYLIKALDSNGAVTKLEYDAQGRMTKVIQADGSAHRFQYAFNGLLTKKENPDGGSVVYNYDSAGRVVSVKDSEGGGQTFSATISGNKKTYVVTSAKGEKTIYEDITDDSGTVSVITFPDGTKKVVTTSADGLTKTAKEPNGTITKVVFGFDPKFGIRYPVKVTVTTPSGLTNTLFFERKYDQDGVLTETISDGVNVAKVIIDPASFVVTRQSPSGLVTKIWHDPDNGRVTKIAGLGVLDITYEYDGLGRMTKIKQGGRQIIFQYDEKGLVSVSDSMGRVEKVVRDKIGRIIGVEKPDGAKIQMVLDGKGAPTEFTRPSGAKVSYIRNTVSNLIQTNYGGGISLSYGYSPDRELIETIFPSKAKKTMQIQGGKILGITYSDGDSISFSYYSETGKLKSLTSSDGFGYAFVYDGFLVTKQTSTGNPEMVVEREYDNSFRLKRWKAGKLDISIKYDNEDRPIQIGEFTLKYDTSKAKVSEVNDPLFKTMFTYDTYGKLQEVIYSTSNGGDEWRLSYQRDEIGRIIKKSEGKTGSMITYEYSYDVSGRVVEVKKDGQLIESYTYDGDGNRVSAVVPMMGWDGEEWVIGDGDKLLSSPDADFEYDANGCLAKRKAGSTTIYQHSLGGKLRKVVLPNGKVIEYLYDPIGLKSAKKVDGVMVERYIYEGLKLIAVLTKDGAIKEQYLWVGDVPTILVKGDSKYRLLTDENGSVRRVYSESLTLVQAYDYDTFGNRTYVLNPDFKMAIGFAGGRYDEDSGLISIGFRDFDPTIGRFIQPDMIGLDGAENLYAFRAGVGVFDPTGLWEFGLSWFTGLGVGVRVGYKDGHFWVCPEVGVGAQSGIGFGVSSEGDYSVDVGPLSGSFNPNAGPPITLTNPGYNATTWVEGELSGKGSLGGVLGAQIKIEGKLGECDSSLTISGGPEFVFQDYTGGYTWSTNPSDSGWKGDFHANIDSAIDVLKKKAKPGFSGSAKASAVGCHVFRF